ncbi:MAG: hypothetical protein VXV86_03165, partial [Verrucomicrobiota bacterium]|nr:hypothetical protein [Verrucomicrobiota bacterium]
MVIIQIISCGEVKKSVVVCHTIHWVLRFSATRNNFILNFISNHSSILLDSDKEQINRVFLNLIKNSIESIQQKAENQSNFD